DVCKISGEVLQLLEQATAKFRLSARAYQRVLRVARTIADLAAQKDIAATHIAEAVSLRQMDKRRLQ
ncbi:MAG: magnesium chelatase, partial [Gammaproteobacteria bacterium]|nr:magnesium chelatase [Gammaproteobacteria bacterium]